MKEYVKNVYQQSLVYYRDEGRGNVVDKHQAHLAATLIKEQGDYILNTSSDQLSAIKTNLLSITSTLPESNTRQERQLELLFGIGATLFSLYNYINTQSDTAQITRNKNSISSLTHIAEIQEDHLKHLEIEMATNRYLYLQNLKFNPALLLSATQDVTMQTTAISNKFTNTIQQLQVKRLSPDFLQGDTILKLFRHLQNIAHNGNMDLLISAPSDLFQIDVSYFYKSHQNELNIFLHVPMVNPNKLLKFFQFIKFPLAQNLGSNLTMMPNINQDLLAIGQNHQFNLLSQSDLNSCTQYGTTYLCKGRDVLRTDLESTCLGSYYLENIDAIHTKCKFDLIPPQEHVFQIASNKWIISSPSDFSTIIKCPSTFNSITIRKSTTITVPPGCQVDLKSHIITPDSAVTDSDLETIHYEWAWSSNIMFPKFHTSEFEATLIHLRNLTAISIDNINEAVALAIARSKSGNKTVQEYFNDLENIKQDEFKPLTSVDNVFITVLTFVSIATCYLLFKMCFTSSHNIKPLFPSYRLREWTNKRSGSTKRSFDKMNKDSKEMEPLGPNKETENNIYPNIPNAGDTAKNSASFHNMKF